MIALSLEMLTSHVVHVDYLLAYELGKVDISILQFKSKNTLGQILLPA